MLYFFSSCTERVGAASFLLNKIHMLKHVGANTSVSLQKLPYFLRLSANLYLLQERFVKSTFRHKYYILRYNMN